MKTPKRHRFHPIGFLSLTLVAVAFISLKGQSLPGKPRFENVVVAPYTFKEGQGSLGVNPAPDGVYVSGVKVTLESLICLSHPMKYCRVSGPAWVSTKEWNFNAAMPANSSRSQIPSMIGTMLDEKFSLKLHQYSGEFSVYALTIVPGGDVRLKESSAAADDRPVPTRRVGTDNSFYSIVFPSVEVRHLRTSEIADMLTKFVGKPVLNLTDLAGSYDLAFDVTAEDFQIMNVFAQEWANKALTEGQNQMLRNAQLTSLMKGLETCGLQLENRTAPLPALMIDEVKQPAPMLEESH